MGSNRLQPRLRKAAIAMASSAAILASTAAAAQSPVDLANPLVGTAPLDDPAVIGNAPPPGEPVYSGQTSPGARLPHGSVAASPVNNNIEILYPNGVPDPYYYTNPTMIGDRQSSVLGKSGEVRVDHGGRGSINKKNT